jgi:hypothetical protein
VERLHSIVATIEIETNKSSHRETLHMDEDESRAAFAQRVRAAISDDDLNWKALANEQRLDLVRQCCRGCGSLDTGCRCWDDS